MFMIRLVILSLSALLDEFPEQTFGRTPPSLILAVIKGQTHIVQNLLDKGADVNVKDMFGRTALLVAALWGYSSIVRILLENGADVNERDNRAQTALMAASFNGHTAIVKDLLNSGAEVNAKSDEDETALFWAIKKNKIDIAKILKQAET